MESENKTSHGHVRLEEEPDTENPAPPRRSSNNNRCCRNEMIVYLMITVIFTSIAGTCIFLGILLHDNYTKENCPNQNFQGLLTKIKIIEDSRMLYFDVFKNKRIVKSRYIIIVDDTKEYTVKKYYTLHRTCKEIDGGNGREVVPEDDYYFKKTHYHKTKTSHEAFSVIFFSFGATFAFFSMILWLPVLTYVFSIKILF